MGWKPFKAISRAVTINPKSFTPANIVRVLVGGQITIYTGGVAALSPSIGKTTVVSSNPKKASIVTSAFVGANTFGTVQAGDPSKVETPLNKIARIFGGTVASLVVGSAAANVLTTPASASVNALPPGVQGPTQGLTVGERFGNFLGATISTSSTVYATGGISRVVLDLFGKKAGTAILQLFSGDVAGFVKTVSTPEVKGPELFYPTFRGVSASGGGGAGLGIGSNTGQTQGTSLLFPVIGIALLGVLFLIIRKK